MASLAPALRARPSAYATLSARSRSSPPSASSASGRGARLTSRLNFPSSGAQSPAPIAASTSAARS